MLRAYRFHLTVLSILALVFIFFYATGGRNFDAHDYKDCSNQSVDWEFDKKIEGISLVAPPEPIGSWACDPMLEIGAEWVCIMPYGFVREEGSKVIYNHPFQWWGEQRPGVIQSVLIAKEKGMKVVLKPHLWTQGVYTGAFRPKNKRGWAEFESTYSDFILDYAKLADSLGVEVFCVGTELSSSTAKNPAFWSSLICHVRDNYSGKLSYAANWDNYKKIKFWQELDVVGVNAYFPLDTSSSPTVATIAESWSKWKTELKAFSEGLGKKILFTELGYRSMDQGIQRPWDAAHHGEFNEKVQAMAYSGFFEGVWNEEWLAGVLFWKWHAEHRKAGGPGNTRYTPQNKLAEAIIAQHFKEAL